MSSADRFKPYAPDVHAVVRLEEELPSEHPVHVFVDLVRSIDLAHFVIPPGPKGEKPYHPHALFGVLAWGYLHGVRSSRKLARLARQEATFVYLAWCCARLQAAGKEALLLVWDNAPWHVSRAVRTWIRAHNRRVTWSGRGVRSMTC
jgi:hypothetical protein